MFDTHCHLTFKDFAGRVPQVLADAQAAGVHGCITVGTTAANARESLALATTYDNVWCSAGAHPLYSDEAIDWDVITQIIQHDRCVAWGELGLDYHYDKPDRRLQHEVLEHQLGVIESVGNDKPIIVHCRKSFDDLISIFRSTTLDPGRFVFHCFTGDSDDARKVLDFGGCISFTGVVTFANAPEVAEAAKIVPLDRMMVETDAPFLTPEPMRKVRPNEPKFVVHVAERLAELRGVAFSEVAEQLDNNARSFFGIDF